jgi:nascent polypeptide-associated complex subunit alpha
MFGGGGGMNPRKMQQMMEQMGVDFDELDAAEVVIRLGDGTELHFDDADVNRISAQGQETYQVVGEPEERDAAGELAAGDADETADEAATDEGGADDGGTIPDADVEIVAQRTGVDEAAAREALAAEDGDLAAAVDRLE